MKVYEYTEYRPSLQPENLLKPGSPEMAKKSSSSTSQSTTPAPTSPFQIQKSKLTVRLSPCYAGDIKNGTSLSLAKLLMR